MGSKPFDDHRFKVTFVFDALPNGLFQFFPRDLSKVRKACQDLLRDHEAIGSLVLFIGSLRFLGRHLLESVVVRFDLVSRPDVSQTIGSPVGSIEAVRTPVGFERGTRGHSREIVEGLLDSILFENNRRIFGLIVDEHLFRFHDHHQRCCSFVLLDIHCSRIGNTQLEVFFFLLVVVLQLMIQTGHRGGDQTIAMRNVFEVVEVSTLRRLVLLPAGFVHRLVMPFDVVTPAIAAVTQRTVVQPIGIEVRMGREVRIDDLRRRRDGTRSSLPADRVQLGIGCFVRLLVVAVDVLLNESRMIGTKLTERTLVLQFGIVTIAGLGVEAPLFHVGIDRLLCFFVRQLQDFEVFVRMTLPRVTLSKASSKSRDEREESYLDVPTKIRSPATDRTHVRFDVDVCGDVKFQFRQGRRSRRASGNRDEVRGETD